MPVSKHSCEPSPSLSDTAASLCDTNLSLCDTEAAPRSAVDIDRSRLSHANTAKIASYPSINFQPHNADSCGEQEKDPWDEKTETSDFDYLGEKYLEGEHQDENDELSKQGVRKGRVDPESQASTGRRKWTVSDFIPSMALFGMATVIGVPTVMKATGHL